MWPLERQRDVLRIGWQSAEMWVASPAGFELHASWALNAKPGAAETLEMELTAWLRTLGGKMPRAARLDIVLESCWLPVLLIEVGRDALGRTLVEQLARHRMAELHLWPGAPAKDLELLLDHRPGDAQAMAYGLAPSTRHAVMGATAAAGHRAASLQPALGWARRRLVRRGRGPRTGWWGWLEQDRALLCRLERGRVTALNAGAPVPDNESDQARLFAVEAARCGLGESDVAVMMSWKDLSAPTAGPPGLAISSALKAAA